MMTVDMLDALPEDGQRYELIDGELFVTPAPSDVHQFVVGALYARLRQYLRPSAALASHPLMCVAAIHAVTACSRMSSSYV